MDSFLQLMDDMLDKINDKMENFDHNELSEDDKKFLEEYKSLNNYEDE